MLTSKDIEFKVAKGNYGRLPEVAAGPVVLAESQTEPVAG